MEIDKSDNLSNSDSDSPEVESEDDEVDASIIAEMQQKIKENPYVYDSHVSLIALLRKAGELDKLREAREEMSKIFPLTSELWLDWLIDEEKLAVTEDEKQSVLSLFDRAVKDYASVNVWLEYCQYVIGLMGSEGGIERVRNTFDRALTAVGIHVAQGSLIWDAYREFEDAILSSMQASQNNLDSEEEKKLELQKNKLCSIFRRQLSVPLIFMDKTYKEFQEHQEIDSYTEQHYQKALKMLDVLQPFEDALYKSEAPHLEEYKKYIEFEKKEGNPARVQCIFERALIENCLVPDLWWDYTRYVDRVIKGSDIVLPIHKRAVRNCPWSVLCWSSYLVALERHNEPHDFIKAAFEKSLQGFSNGEEYRQIWITYLDYLRRRIKWEEDHKSELEELNATFERAVEHMSYYREGDPQCSLLQYWAKIKAKYCKDVSHGREIWSSIMNQGHHSEADMWMQYANFERIYGDDKHYRKILLKGLQSVNDWPETLGNALLTFEREEGTLETLDTSKEKYEKQFQRVEEKRQRVAEKEATRQENEAEYRRAVRAIRRDSYSKFFMKSKSHKKEKVEPDVQVDAEGFKIPSIPSRISPILEGKEKNSEKSMNEQLDEPMKFEDKQKRSERKRPAEQESNENKKRQKVEDDDSSHGTTVKHDPSKDHRSVFLSNLSYDISEDKIKEAFSSIGNIEEIRLVKDYKGRSKGYCYVVFSTQEDAKQALKKDREFVNDRPMFVSPCEDRRQGSSKKFKFSTNLEKNKIFVKRLPFSSTKDDLVEIFKEFGALKEVRIATYRNGNSKGFAYIEFEDEASATAAVVKTDGLVIQDHTISVAISNPPERKGKKFDSKQSGVTISSLLGGGGRSSETGSRGRGRTQLTLLPRALQRPQTQPKTETNNSNSSVQNGGSETSKKLSNDDFRNMLLKK